jgi:steroid 5-alpha reductase family enzyme
MSDATTALVVAAIVIAALMTVTWAVSVVRRNASIVDIVWGIGFVVVAWAVFATTSGNGLRRGALVAMTTIWGLRLATHLLIRNAGRGEDFRYRAMRRRHGDRFAAVSLYSVFGVQGVLMWVVSLPVQLGQTSHRSVGVLLPIGVAAWAVGLFFEAVGDAQLAQFKKDPANAGIVMDRGLWRYTRHPNYFGDACVWWGIAIVAAETGIGAIGLVGAVVMTWLLRRVSGVTLLEKSLVKRRQGYTEYVDTTSPFIPRRPRARSSPSGRG